MLFVRHSLPVIEPGVSPGRWHLSSEGRARAAELGAALRRAANDIDRTRVVASTETKAVETASMLGCGRVEIDGRAREVAKPWYDNPEDHQADALRYLSGDVLPDWEPQIDALRRFGSAVTAVRDDPAMIVTHGTVLSLWLSREVDGLDPCRFWLQLRMPDAWRFDPGSSTGPVRPFEAWTERSEGR